MSVALLLGVVAGAWGANLSGEVRARGSAEPLPGAEVVAGERVLEADERGRFSGDIPDGVDTVEVRAPGYEPMVVQLPESGPLEVWLRASDEPGDIVVEARRRSPHTSRQVLDRERVEKTPGTHDDPLRLVQSLPGVAVTPEYAPTAGDVALRGAPPAQSRVLLDGVQLPYLYHFQQYASVIHTRLLDEVAVYPSAFGSAYGDAVGGVVAVRSRAAATGDAAVRPHGGVNVNSIMAGGHVRAPTGGKAAVSASARRSFMDAFESESDQYTLWPIFWDYLGRVDIERTADRRISLTALGAGDRYGRYAGDTAVLDPLEQDSVAAVSFDRGFHGVLLTGRAGDATTWHEATAGWIGDAWTVELPGAGQRRDEQSLTLREQSSFLVSDRLQLNGGGDVRLARLHRFADTDRAWPELAVEAPLLARGVALDETASRAVGGIWAEPLWTFGTFELQPGVRLQGDSATGTVRAEPRLALRQALGADAGLRASVGRYGQAPSLDALSPAAGDPSLAPTTAEHASLGADVAVRGRWEIASEGWGRRVHGAVVEEAGASPRTEDAWAAGAEVTTRYRLRDRFFTWVSLSVSRVRTDGGADPSAPAGFDAVGDYDQPVAASAVLSWDFAPRWNVGLRYRYATGLPQTPIAGAVYDGNADTWTPTPGPLNSDRMPNYQKVDVHLERAFELRRWTLTLYGEAWWVPGDANVLYRVYNYDYSERADVVGPGLVPLLGARASF